MTDKIKHYSGGTVWGKIHEMKRKKTKSEIKHVYVDLTLDCPHSVYGLVRVFARLWGTGPVGNFLNEHKAGDEVRLDGFFSQYEKEGKTETFSTFNFTRFLPVPVDGLQEYKAAFRLTGKVTEAMPGYKYEETKEIRLTVEVFHEAKDKYPEKTDTFKVYLPESLLSEDRQAPMKDDIVAVKGYMVKPEDEFGGNGGVLRPQIKVFDILQEGDAPF